MYATCLFCDAPFGANDALETLPVGRRIAFDAFKGRLWVVCRRCERWNLAPLEERWEPVEECERRFRGTRLRVTTDNIGMARLPDGTDLVRVGRPLRPEFAAWRYGDQFGRRRRRALALGAGGAVAAVATAPVALTGALAALSSGGILASGWVAGGVQLPYQAAKEWLLSERVVARLPVPVLLPRAFDDLQRGPGPIGSAPLTVRVRHLRDSVLVPDAGGALRLRLAHDAGESEIGGAGAARALGVLLARANQWGASRLQVRAAVRAIDERGDAAGWLRAVARRSSRPGGRVLAQWRGVGAFALTPTERLAVEMALHEDAERRVLEGELAHLAEAWQEAEEIAAIADAL